MKSADNYILPKKKIDLCGYSKPNMVDCSLVDFQGEPEFSPKIKEDEFTYASGAGYFDMIITNNCYDSIRGLTINLSSNETEPRYLFHYVGTEPGITGINSYSGQLLTVQLSQFDLAKGESVSLPMAIQHWGPATIFNVSGYYILDSERTDFSKTLMYKQ